MDYKTEKIVGKMSVEKLHETLLELEKKAVWINLQIEILDKQTVQVVINWR